MKLIMCLTVLFTFFAGTYRTSQEAAPTDDRRLIFSGEVLAVGPSPGFGSGGVRAYQLVKYRVLDICEGAYEGQEIITDHLILEADALKDLKVGDKVCVGVTKSKDIAPRYDDEKIRKSSDAVETYYIVLGFFIKNCQCSGSIPAR